MKITGRGGVMILVAAAACAVCATGCRGIVTACSSIDYTEIQAALLATPNVERRLEMINGRYILGATDSIQVMVRDHPNFSGAHTIRPDGYITFEDVGDVYVEGMTPQQAAAAIGEHLGSVLYDADVVVRVTGFNSKKYYMFGETPGVGEHGFDGDVTILRAFGRARGVNVNAAWERIRLIRVTHTTRQVFKVHLVRVTQRGDWTTNFQLKANDVIYVPPTFLAEVGYFVDKVLFPVKSVFSGWFTVTSLGGL